MPSSVLLHALEHPTKLNKHQIFMEMDDFPFMPILLENTMNPESFDEPKQLDFNIFKPGKNRGKHENQNNLNYLFLYKKKPICGEDYLTN